VSLRVKGLQSLMPTYVQTREIIGTILLFKQPPLSCTGLRLALQSFCSHRLHHSIGAESSSRKAQLSIGDV
jgi:hypothetical protein